MRAMNFSKNLLASDVSFQFTFPLHRHQHYYPPKGLYQLHHLGPDECVLEIHPSQWRDSHQPQTGPHFQTRRKNQNAYADVIQVVCRVEDMVNDEFDDPGNNQQCLILKLRRSDRPAQQLRSPNQPARRQPQLLHLTSTIPRLRSPQEQRRA